MTDQKQMKKQAILRVLKRSGASLQSALIAQSLTKRGYEMSERTVRLYLQELDKEGLTDNKGKRGRLITEKGLAELSAARTLERVGSLSAQIDQMTYRMDFDLARRTGSVVVNATMVTRDQILPCLDNIYRVFEKGYAMGTLTGLLEPGETVGNLVVPAGMLGFCSVCSITLNGVLLKHGIPTRSRFGGLMEMRDNRPVRFVEMITYDGTSIDPLEIFIRSAMTDCVGAVTTGSGAIGASFREIPAASCDLVADLADNLESVGLGGLVAEGQPGQPLFDIPVSEGRAGAVVIGGLNPAAILEEQGIRISSRALAGLLEFTKLFHYEELRSRI